MRVTPQQSARRWCRFAFVLAITLASAVGIRGAGAAETLTVVVAPAQIERLPVRVGTMIIGTARVPRIRLMPE